MSSLTCLFLILLCANPIWFACGSVPPLWLLVFFLLAFVGFLAVSCVIVWITISLSQIKLKHVTAFLLAWPLLLCIWVYYRLKEQMALKTKIPLNPGTFAIFLMEEVERRCR